MFSLSGIHFCLNHVQMNGGIKYFRLSNLSKQLILPPLTNKKNYLSRTTMTDHCQALVKAPVAIHLDESSPHSSASCYTGFDFSVLDGSPPVLLSCPLLSRNNISFFCLIYLVIILI